MTSPSVQAATRVTSFGVVGVGSLGRHHARILHALDGAKLVGIHDLDSDRADVIASEYGVEAFSELDRLLGSVDALVVATPTASHAPIAIAALEAGSHVFVEKPIAPSLEEADAILEAAERSGRIVQVGHVERLLAIQERKDDKLMDKLDAVLSESSDLENAFAPEPFVREVPGRLHTAYEREWRAEGRPLHFWQYCRRPRRER